MPTIHPLASVDPKAEIGEDVVIGPFTYVQAGVVIGARTVLESHVTIKGGTTMGEDNYVAQGAVLGGDPQDRKYHGEPTYLHIGDRNVFREYVTVHRATGEGMATSVADDCFLMAHVHLGHNVTLEKFVTITNSVGVSGHVTVEEYANIGGMSAIHQWVRIGKVAFVGGMTRVVRDVPPFMISEGLDQEVRDINAVGLRRYGVGPDARLALHKACRLLFKSQLGLTHAIETVRREVPSNPEIEYLLAFEQRRFKGKNGRGDQP